jgi:hypothetical protein
MSYASYVIICHIMTYDAYVIEIWHKSNLTILVSKPPFGPQQSHPFIRFWLKKIEKKKKMKNAFEYFPFINLKIWKSFAFLAEFSVTLRVIKEITKWNETLGSSYLYICQWYPTKKQIIFAFYCFLTNPTGSAHTWISARPPLKPANFFLIHLKSYLVSKISEPLYTPSVRKFTG